MYTEHGSVRWLYNSEYSGYPIRYSKRHYCDDSDVTLCGVRIPEERKYNRWADILQVGWGCGDVDCVRCIRIAERNDLKGSAQDHLNSFILDLSSGGLINPAEVLECNPTLSRQKVIDSILRLGGRQDGQSNWYRFKDAPGASTGRAQHQPTRGMAGRTGNYQ